MEGIRYVFDNHKKVIEGAAGVSVASYMKRSATSDENDASHQHVVVLCGRNISNATWTDIVTAKKK